MPAVTCQFLCVSGMDESPICPQLMDPPPIGSLLFFEGEGHGYRVVDVQYQFRKDGRLGRPQHVLIMAIVIVSRVPFRAAERVVSVRGQSRTKT